MNWREKIEAQIADLRCGVDEYDLTLGEKAANTLQALLDVAVAAESVNRWHGAVGSALTDLEDALDKLREVGDDR